MMNTVSPKEKDVPMELKELNANTEEICAYIEKLIKVLQPVLFEDCRCDAEEVCREMVPLASELRNANYKLKKAWQRISFIVDNCQL